MGQTTTVTETVVSNAAIKVNCGTDAELLIEGLQNIVLPTGFTSETITVKSMGKRIDKVLPVGGSYEAIDINYNFLAGDASQTFMQQASLNNVDIRTMRFYIENKRVGDFAALDLVSDPSGSYRVGTFSSPKGNKSELLTGTLQITPAGPSILYINHASGTDLEFTAQAGGATVASTVQDFVDLGFKPGMTMIIDRLGSLDPLYVKIKTVSANLITLEEGVSDEEKVLSETGSLETAIHAAVPMLVEEDV